MKQIFVFGSNLAGVHGSGAARDALMHHGAIYHLGVGPAGNSYALPTKDQNIETLPLWKIKLYIDQFIEHATITQKINEIGDEVRQLAHKPASINQIEFQVTRIGCGLAGYKDEHIAPMFIKAPLNCWFDTAWKPWLGDTVYYWGHK